MIPASGYPYEFEELSASTLKADGTIYPGQPYPSAVAVSPADGGLLAAALDNGYSSPDISVFKLGTPSPTATMTTNNPDGTANVSPHGLALSADGSRVFAVTSDWDGQDSAFRLWTFNLDPTPTNTSVSVSPTPLTSGQQATLTASVSPTDGGGNVSFEVDGSPVPGCDSAPLTSGDTATCTTTSLPVGSDNITATYANDLAYSSSSGATSATVDRAPTTGVSVHLSRQSIVADGTSRTLAVADVFDASGNLVPGDIVQFSADPAGAVTFGPVTDDGGSYTATITSTTTTGPVTITAADVSDTPNVSGQATLTETAPPCPALSVTVRLSSTSIAADGVSTATATATVQDSEGHPVTGATIQFSAFPAGDVTIGPVTDNGDGTYAATITSGTTAGPVTITATDISAPNGCAVLDLSAPSGTTTAPSGPTQATPGATSAPQPVSGTTPAGDTGSPGSPAPVSNASRSASTEPSGNSGAASNNSDPSPVQVDAVASPGQIKSSLTALLAPRGLEASVTSVVKHGYDYSYSAPAAGRLTIQWHSRANSRRMLVGSVTKRLGKPGRSVVKVELTEAGRTELAHAHKLAVTTLVTFAPTGAAKVTRSGSLTLR